MTMTNEHSLWYCRDRVHTTRSCVVLHGLTTPHSSVLPSQTLLLDDVVGRWKVKGLEGGEASSMYCAVGVRYNKTGEPKRGPTRFVWKQHGTNSVRIQYVLYLVHHTGSLPVLSVL
jgi:hypothetical protein